MGTGLIAKVAVVTPLAHLDRPFDYAIPADKADSVRPGIRVRVRFSGKLRDGYVLAVESSSTQTQLLPLHSVASEEVVLTPEIAELTRAVADHYSGSFADVIRLAIPPRHMSTEKATPPSYPKPHLQALASAPLHEYPHGASFIEAIKRGDSPKAAWTLAPTAGASGDWIGGFISATQSALESGRGALLIVPDQHDLDQLCERLTSHFGKGSFVEIAASYGPAARYRRFLAAKRGSVSIVVGTRSAIFTPVKNLGLIALWDDGDDSYAELRAPYLHAREVVALRAHKCAAALIFAHYVRTAEIQQLVERQWLFPIEKTPGENRAASPKIINVIQRPSERQMRIPHDVFAHIRVGLAQGSVLIQVMSDSRQTASELGKAFPQVKVVFSANDHRLSEIADTPALVISTPGAEPTAVAGYAAAVILDADAMLRRADLRVGEETLRRWMSVAAMVRPAEAGGSVLLVGDHANRPAQALLRLDSLGFAAQELQDRIQAKLPPSVKMIRLEGSFSALKPYIDNSELPASAEVVGSIPTPDPESYVAILRCPPTDGAALVHAVRKLSSVRAAKKAEPVKVMVDPHIIE
ncbi:MAG: hypothetical protein FWG47_02625 [Propionibacteriaceae bacterium]|nr:hypothetical protein [Propionibacteriaceae bacterium]